MVLWHWSKSTFVSSSFKRYICTDAVCMCFRSFGCEFDGIILYFFSFFFPFCKIDDIFIVNEYIYHSSTAHNIDSRMFTLFSGDSHVANFFLDAYLLLFLLFISVRRFCINTHYTYILPRFVVFNVHFMIILPFNSIWETIIIIHCAVFSIPCSWQLAK